MNINKQALLEWFDEQYKLHKKRVKWISTKERTPYPDQVVFVLIDNGNEPPYIDFGVFKTYKTEHVPYWMPLTDAKRLIEQVVGINSPEKGGEGE